MYKYLSSDALLEMTASTALRGRVLKDSASARDSAAVSTCSLNWLVPLCALWCTQVREGAALDDVWPPGILEMGSYLVHWWIWLFLTLREGITMECLGTVSHPKFRPECTAFSFKIMGLMLWNRRLQDNVIPDNSAQSSRPLLFLQMNHFQCSAFILSRVIIPQTSFSSSK